MCVCEAVTNVSSTVTSDALSKVPPLPIPEEAADSSSGVEGLASEPIEEEVKKTVSQLRSGRAPGKDDITAELLKLGRRPRYSG